MRRYLAPLGLVLLAARILGLQVASGLALLFTTMNMGLSLQVKNLLMGGFLVFIPVMPVLAAFLVYVTSRRWRVLGGFVLVMLWLDIVALVLFIGTIPGRRY